MVALCTYLPSACMLASWSGVCVLDGIHRPDIINKREDFAENPKSMLVGKNYDMVRVSVH